MPQDICINAPATSPKPATLTFTLLGVVFVVAAVLASTGTPTSVTSQAQIGASQTEEWHGNVRRSN